jgi:hypothetical protein
MPGVLFQTSGFHCGINPRSEESAMERRQALKNLALLFPVVLILTLLAACQPEPVVPQDARILIIDPAAESSQSSSTVTIRTFIERLDLVEKAGQLNSQGEGHIVYYMDAAPPLVQGESALSAAGSYAVSAGTSYAWDNVPPGEHTFWVQLVNNDDTPLQPPQAVRVYVTVR